MLERESVSCLFLPDAVSDMAVCRATNHHDQQPAVAAGSFIRGLFSTSQTSSHLLWTCVPFKEICNPALKSVCPCEQDDSCLASYLPLGCFYCWDRRQGLKELLPLGPTSWRADQQETLLLHIVRKELYGKHTYHLIYSARASVIYWLQMPFFLSVPRLSWEFQYLRFLMFMTWR